VLLRRIIGGKRGKRADRKINTKLIASLFILFAATATKAERMISAGRLSRNEE
jgi:hypothetical protein